MVNILSITKCSAIISSLLFFLAGCVNYSINQGAEAYARGDFDEAVKHWNPYAKAGDPYAQFNIGIIWEQGLGRTPLNSGQAMQWYLLSARQGYTPAMVRLANLQHASGYNDAAESWYVLAARWGNSDAYSAIRALGKEVPSADLLAQQQDNKAVADQKIINAIILSLSYLADTTLYYQYAHQPPPPIAYKPTPQVDSGCSSDFACRSGYSCIKAPFQSSGVCMKSVNTQGLPVYNTPKSDSIYINTQGQCRFDTDCPIGFKCDPTYKVCVK
jgi:hypothetical protein